MSKKEWEKRICRRYVDIFSRVMSRETKLAGHSSQEVKIVNDSIDGPGF